MSPSPMNLLLGIALLIVMVGGTLLWIWAIIDCIKYDFSSPNEKVAWILIVVFLGPLGAILYVVLPLLGTGPSKSRSSG